MTALAAAVLALGLVVGFIVGLLFGLGQSLRILREIRADLEDPAAREELDDAIAWLER